MDEANERRTQPRVGNRIFTPRGLAIVSATEGITFLVSANIITDQLPDHPFSRHKVFFRIFSGETKPRDHEDLLVGGSAVCSSSTLNASTVLCDTDAIGDITCSSSSNYLWAAGKTKIRSLFLLLLRITLFPVHSEFASLISMIGTLTGRTIRRALYRIPYSFVFSTAFFRTFHTFVAAYPPAKSSSTRTSHSSSINIKINAIMNQSPQSTSPKTVMVTGANGFLASHIVKGLLEAGHSVHACVRNADNAASVEHLQALEGADQRLTLFSTGDLKEATDATRPFDAPMADCDAVFHAATPISVKFDQHSGEHEIYEPAMLSTKELLACVQRHSDTVGCLVLTSSMSAVAPRPEPSIKDESHWSDPDDQRQRENWYGCTKTSQERLVRDWVRRAKSNHILPPDFVYSAICPTVVIGPKLNTIQLSSPQDSVGGTMGILQKWLQGGRSVAPNDSLSFIHVSDCAKMHTRILQLTANDIHEEQRYMSLMESLHWNDILKLFQELHPALPDYQPYTGPDELAVPTQFDLTHMQSLEVPCRTTREALKDSIDYLKSIRAL